MDLHLPDLHIMMTSYIVNSVYAFISREITFIVGLHVDENGGIRNFWPSSLQSTLSENLQALWFCICERS